MAKPNQPVKQGAAPFMPPVLVQHVPANLGGGGPAKTYAGPWEDGAGLYVNYDGVTPVFYNGQTQTKFINQTFRP